MNAQEERAALWKKQELWKAGMLIRHLGDRAMDYENAVMALKDVVNWATTLPAHDPAFEHFIIQMHDLRKLCHAHAILGQEQDGKVRVDHLQAIPVIWSYRRGEVTEETTLYIPLGVREDRVHTELKIAATTRLAKEGIPHFMVIDLEVERL